MNITFYNQLNDNRVLTKNLGAPIHTAECTPFGECSLHSPVITVRQFTGYGNINYCYIDEYNRYYYITDIIAKSGGILEIRCKVDVLKTYDNVIRQCSAVCTANENVGATYITDTRYPLQCRKSTTVYEFEGEPFNTETATDNTYNFVLTVAGGTAAEPEPEPDPEPVP